jgi:hypothetical protein
MSTYFRNIQNNGLWTAGGNYTFEWYRLWSDYPTLENKTVLGASDSANFDCLYTKECANYLISNPNTPITTQFGLNWANHTLTDIVNNFGWGSGNSHISKCHQTTPAVNGWSTSSVHILSNAPGGKYCLIWSDINNNILISYELYNLIEILPNTINLNSPRPDSYNPDVFWNGSEWETAEVVVSGGGRYKNNLIAIGENSTGQGLIYYGES